MGLKLGEFIDKNIESVNKVISCLKAMNKGMEVEIGSFTYKIGETHNEGFSLLFKMKVISSTDNVEREEWFGYQGDFINFSEECAKLSDEDITIIRANTVLNEIKF